MIALLLALLQSEPADPPRLSLPAGPAARAWSAVERATQLAPLPPECEVFAQPSAWNQRDTWSRWADILNAANGDTDARHAARVAATLAALSQGRSEDAWDHFAALADRPQWLVALAPYFVFGGPSSEFANEVVIAPSLPPLNRPARERLLGLGRLEAREMRWVNVGVGAARVDLRVAVEFEGLQIDVEHRSGEEATLGIVLPELLDFEFSSVYVDWEVEPQVEGPHVVSVSATTPKIEIYARCRPVQLRWPMTLPNELDTRARRDGFQVLVAENDLASPRALGFADALAKLTRSTAIVRSIAAPPTQPPWSGLSLDFSSGPERVRKFRTLLSLLERWALER